MDEHFYLADGISFSIVGVFMLSETCSLNVNGRYKYSVRVTLEAALEVSPH
jgi:hypothetical protein